MQEAENRRSRKDREEGELKEGLNAREDYVDESERFDWTKVGFGLQKWCK